MSYIPEGWTKHEPGPCPVPPDTMVGPLFRDRWCPALARADQFNWSENGPETIIAYRISTPASAATGGGDARDRITGDQWVAGRDAFVRYADRYRDATKYEMASAIADVAPAEIYKAIEAAAPPPPAQAADGWRPKVRELEWHELGGICLFADTPIGRYLVQETTGGATWWRDRHEKHGGPHPFNLSAAKAAAQADYEARILSALATPPAPEAGT